MKLGIVGLGVAGAHMLVAGLRHPSVTVTAVADVEPSLLDLVGDRVLARYRDIEQLCADRVVDAIYIASPTELHVAHTLIALSANKDVILEKPMSIDLLGARRIIDAAANAGRVLVVGHSMSYEPFVRAARDAAEQYDLGRPAALLLHEETDWMCRPRLPEELDDSVGGGPVLRQGAHLVDVARYITYGAPVTAVEARGFAMLGQRCHGSFLATMVAGEAQTTLAYNGHAATPHSGEPMAETKAPLAASGTATTAGQSAPQQPPERPEARKKRRNVAALTAALNHLATGVVPPTPPALRRFVFVYERGQVTVDREQVELLHANGTRVLVPTHNLSSGRHAVLDEFLTARNGGAFVHDGAWGFENLRVCLEMVDSASHQSRTPDRLSIG